MVYREISLRELLTLSRETMRSTAEVLIIVGAASAFAYMVVSAQLPQMILRTVSSLTTSRWAVMALINLFLLIIGCFMEPVAAITITVPVMMPLVRQLGIDPVHFGLVVVYNLVLGLLTPPVGLVLFVTAKIAGLSVEELVRHILPFSFLTAKPAAHHLCAGHRHHHPRFAHGLSGPKESAHCLLSGWRPNSRHLPRL